MLKHANLTDQPWLEGLSEEQIDTLAELPKEERLRHYAEMHDKEPDEALTKLGDASGIQVLEDFEMVEEPIWQNSPTTNQRIPVPANNQWAEGRGGLGRSPLS